MLNRIPLLSKLRHAMRELATHGPQASTTAIQKALGGIVDAVPETDSARPLRDINPPPGDRIDSRASLDEGDDTAPAPAAQPEVSPERYAGFFPDMFSKMGLSANGTPDIPAGADFTKGSFTNLAGMRQYKLYIPANLKSSPPLVVMLHGCTQNPDDFAAGTRMNAAAELEGCLVLYPEQSQGANSSRCWNWFNPGDQQRGGGEPAILAGMTREVAALHHVDPSRIYVAGLSAGGAMAAILGTTYPDLYAGVAVHSGLAAGAASDLSSALAAMKQGRQAVTQFSSPSRIDDFKGIPVIVFHGDADHTVNVRNGFEVLKKTAPSVDRRGIDAEQKSQVAGARAYTRTLHRDSADKVVAEHWLVHGLGHAWAGGSAKGSYTDSQGPQATDELMRFFRTQSKAPSP